jgi:hypothetical protein
MPSKEMTITMRLTSRRLRKRSALLAILAVSALAVTSAAAGAAMRITAFDGRVTANAQGDPYTQAGGHPYEISTFLQFATALDTGSGKQVAVEDVKNIYADLPVGLVGNPKSLPKCSESDLNTSFGAHCPAASQVGYAILDSPGLALPILVGLFNMEPPAGSAAAFGFNLIGTVVHLTASVRAGDQGFTLRIPNIAQTVALNATNLTFWGNPSDPSHDAFRAPAGATLLCGVASIDAPSTDFCFGGGNGAAVGAGNGPLLSLPTNCNAGPAATTVRADSWQHPGQFDTAEWTSHLPPGFPSLPAAYGAPQAVTGCDNLPFKPSIAAQPTTTTSDSPSGLNVDLSFPQDGLDNPDGLATAHLKDATVRLPEGMTVSPSAADGLKGCSDEQIGIGNGNAIDCPDASKIGTVTATTPLLDEQLSGSIYVGTQRSSDPASGDMFRIFLDLANEDRGLNIKLSGKIKADPVTGRLETVFQNNPQLPVSKISLHFKSGPRAPLATPPTCGVKTVDATLSSWGGQVATVSDSFTITGCPASAPLASGFQAGSISPVAGALSPFTLTASRNDGDQELGQINTTLPPGLLGKIAGVPLCDAFHAAAGTCSDASLVGHTTVGAGPGSNPFFLGGKVFLTGPYKGGPYGLSIVVRAVAGPFDLGTVVVRAGIHVDLHTSALSVVSDPLPLILDGVPLRVRTINVAMDRVGFTFNPTSCNAMRVAGQLISPQGGVASVSSHFQLTNCAALPFAPKITFAIGRRGHVAPGRSTPLTVTLTQKAGEAANRRVAVILPINLAAEQGPLQTECTPAQYAADACPAVSRVGTAYAYTPVLAQRLVGPVYFVNVPGQIYPKLAAELSRDGVRVNLEGQITLYKGKRLKTVFETVPDVPISKFVMALVDGKRGPLAVTHNMCTRTRPAVDVAFDAQSGKRVAGQVVLKISGCPKQLKPHPKVLFKSEGH